MDRAEVVALLSRHRLSDSGRVRVTPLTGGVSSHVVRVDDGARCLVVKRALPELTVGDGWYADVARAGTEARFAQVLDELVPGACPRVLAIDEQTHTFVMECAPEGSRTWKHDLLAEAVDQHVAAQVGALFGDLHARSSTHLDAAETFADTTHFTTLRLDPYLREVQRRHPDLTEPVQATIDLLTRSGRCLVHGDASPKNLLVTPSGDVLAIDHEVGHWGHPAFDAAFLANHLCLKAFARPESAVRLGDTVTVLLSTYAEHSGAVGASEHETATVLPALMLARVDGRSPVEYLDSRQRAAVRDLARHLIVESPDLETCLAMVTDAARRCS